MLYKNTLKPSISNASCKNIYILYKKIVVKDISFKYSFIKRIIRIGP
jgi:hypothetical protein